MTLFVTNELAGLLAAPVAAAARRSGLPWPERAGIPLGPSPDPRLGELSSPVALRISAALRPGRGRPRPRGIAEKILGALPSAGGLLARAEVAGSGHLNFAVLPPRWLADLAAVLAGAVEAPAEASAPGVSGAVAAAVGRLAGIRRARAAVGAGEEHGAADLGRLDLPHERDLVRRVSLAAAAGPGGGARKRRREELASAFLDYDARVRLVGPDAGLTRARLALAEAVGRALRGGLDGARAPAGVAA